MIRESEVENFREADSESSFQIEIYKFHDCGLEGLSHQLHAGLPGRASAFSDVTAAAASHHVVPVVGAPLYLGDYMVDGQVTGRKIPAAVLAEITISHKDVLPGERDLSSVNLADELDEPNYSGNSKSSRYRPDRSLGFLDNFDLAVKKEGHGALPRDQSHEFIARVKDYDGFHCCHLVQASLIGEWAQSPLFALLTV